MSNLLVPHDGTNWSPRHARHLLNRAGFGVPSDSIPKLAAMGFEKAVASFIDDERFPDNAPPLDFIEPHDPANDRMEGLNEQEKLARRRERDAVRQTEVQRLKAWWFDQMRSSSRPLREKMALFWHGHFATSAQKVKPGEASADIVRVFRTHGMGSFRNLVFEVGKTPMMLHYLDNRQNVKEKPNENWSRELMELFTIGIGNYSEKDIKEAARAFTGYGLRGGREFYFDARRHDYGEKTFFGRTGNFDGADIINIIMEQPNTARFISRKLWSFFVYENPSDELVEELATVLRAGNYEMRPLLRVIFSSKEFYGRRAMQGLVKSPVQYIAMALDQLEMDPRRKSLAQIGLRALGQDLLYPPNVKGWDGNRAWINTNTLLIRYNMPSYFVAGERMQLPELKRLDEVLMATEGGSEGQRSVKNKRLPASLGTDVSMDEVNGRMPGVAENTRRLLGRWNGQTIGSVADGMIALFLDLPFDKEQRAQLVAVLGEGAPESAPFLLTGNGTRNATRALHLLLSTAEYQLC